MMAATATTDDEARISRQEDIVAALCAEAPSESVRNCIRKYEPQKQGWQIEAALKSLNKQTLVDTLSYLRVDGTEDYKKDCLPHEVLCRVQNLFPDICHICKQEYCVALRDNPIVHCANCGQGCHNACVLQLLGIDELDAGNVDVFKVLNPHASIGLFYLLKNQNDLS